MSDQPTYDPARDAEASTGKRRLLQEALPPKPVLKPTTAKPVWMTDEQFSQFNKISSAGTRVPTSEAKPESPLSELHKLKRPNRRMDVGDQQRKAQEAREHEERKTQHQMSRHNPQHKNYVNNNEHVRDFYNQRAHIARKENRNLSPIIKMRNFNNAIKYILINTYAAANNRVLELGCGKGGDLNKYAMARIRQFVGIDISDASIVEAIKRYKNLRQKPFEAFFATGDCFSLTVPEILTPNFGLDQIQYPFDMVSMQFCLHYSFESEAKARRMLENVSKCLKTGGFFIGTIPDSDFIKAKLARNHVKKVANKNKFGNSIYSVEFEEDVPADGNFGKIYGNKYTYFLKDAVDNVPEYIVPFNAFRALAEDYNLEMRYRGSFTELYKERIPEWFHRLSPKIIEGMKRSDGSYGVEGEEKEACAFYLAFSFEKI
ncbi:hypothetical protein BABINDRAFT_163654 [Babjeviella inositovora NRRL Y-12698]|uniref:mRNA cap guanine-N(7) methyltransferase n=1 Tax=Babjeviella inositovora NRRL Y-12698 TaxID=984486 RepID=A0A1E3QIE3_9ASCO|nr:uncharacterized protein BABINDRAFT_163654 [Babjeviella inositovora NRRL Y-12698]ODQ77410.1 hypothetical protein BABINDRAFT_163654 [Babjeviella inositovora NRRL Y-12698]